MSGLQKILLLIAVKIVVIAAIVVAVLKSKGLI
jgi:hypothetical protein